MLCSVCAHARVCEKLEGYRDPLYFEDARTGEVKCDYFDVITAETSFQEDLDFFVNDCTVAQLLALRERVEERIKEKGDIKMKPLPAIEGMYNFERCPTCNAALIFKLDYCEQCHQKLDWEVDYGKH